MSFQHLNIGLPADVDKRREEQRDPALWRTLFASRLAAPGGLVPISASRERSLSNSHVPFLSGTPASRVGGESRTGVEAAPAYPSLQHAFSFGKRATSSDDSRDVSRVISRSSSAEVDMPFSTNSFEPLPLKRANSEDVAAGGIGGSAFEPGRTNLSFNNSQARAETLFVCALVLCLPLDLRAG